MMRDGGDASTVARLIILIDASADDDAEMHDDDDFLEDAAGRSRRMLLFDAVNRRCARAASQRIGIVTTTQRALRMPCRH